MLLPIRLFVPGLLLCALSLVHSAEQIPLYTYYDEPPFALDQPGNLTAQLASWLSSHSAGRYQFVPVQLPRKRLDLVIGQQPQWRGVVVWANPVFFHDAMQSKYRWSKPYMQDVNLVVSHRSKPVVFKNAASLHGLRVGAVTGRQLEDFEADIAAGKITREDANSVLSNLKKLKLRRIDATFISASSLGRYRQSISDLDDWLYIAPTPRAVVARHFFIAPNQASLLDFLNEMTKQLPKDAQWKMLFKDLQIANRHAR
ncbi:ABC transporter substrate-binding protein [Chitinibacter sp. GC72]|uniref:substrate-binding periplasmic protein n=1 Tax=Chitinibacter sp. GC72 TaxID=1526917 RepID=UPI0012FBF609|nr:transporter substrate-binding domain-containing protein [Chitinibacter sp. GC72]